MTSTPDHGLGPRSAGITYSEVETDHASRSAAAPTPPTSCRPSRARRPRSTPAAAPTRSGSQADAPTNLGSLNLIAGALTIDGGGAGDTAFLSDRADTGQSDTGTLAFSTAHRLQPRRHHLPEHRDARPRPRCRRQQPDHQRPGRRERARQQRLDGGHGDDHERPRRHHGDGERRGDRRHDRRQRQRRHADHQRQRRRRRHHDQRSRRARSP